MRINKLLAVLLFGAIAFASCTSESPILPRGDYDGGILISGEGSGAGTGSVSFVSDDFETVENLIYKKVNSTELSTYLQSMAFDTDRAFIIVDNQNTITVVDRYSFVKEATITEELATPRFMTVADNKGYVTNWGTTEAFVAVYDLTSYEFIKKINIAFGPERIIESNGKLYVSHQGAYGSNNIISVIDIATDVVEEITVSDRPDEMFFNNNGQLVVLSEGAVQYDASWNVIGNTIGSISTINVSNNTIVSQLDFASGQHPSLMVLENNTIYYALSGKVYAIDIDATSLSTSEIVTAEGYLYGMEVEGNSLFTLNASFTDLSTLNVYDITTKAKTQTRSVALGASKIYFN
ncbi:DUF5074 domain-containing protein [uncultured Polaribacter sp.]|uniref:YncE family protein n=1 Tax=uncultured Polaribacter sp. TaxID=174711 RepID=UPI0030D91506|tara:strand:- start:145 stop:1194 length:1050 start_codon:yes stop_codon:yes gene_type:complete